MRFEGCRALVTGGLGFIGSNLALRLLQEGARVTVVDSQVDGCGANLFNLPPTHPHLEVFEGDISDAASLLRDIDVVFNLAGEISHIHSMLDPARDLELNTISQLRFLQAVRAHRRGVRVVFAGTRQIYGVPQYLPIDELHPTVPVDFNGIHKYAAVMYHSLMTRSGDIDGIILQLTNVYGPRMALNVPGQGFLGHFFRRILLGQELEVFGDGRQLRDPVFVDDVVEAFLLAGEITVPASRVYNVGGAEPLSLAEIAKACAHGTTTVRHREFPAEQKAIDIGSYYTDSSLIHAELGWRPLTMFTPGVAKTLEYYRPCLSQYVSDVAATIAS
jgi:UDP-glucose 4-epimerase